MHITRDEKGNRLVYDYDQGVVTTIDKDGNVKHREMGYGYVTTVDDLKNFSDYNYIERLEEVRGVKSGELLGKDYFTRNGWYTDEQYSEAKDVANAETLNELRAMSNAVINGGTTGVKVNYTDYEKRLNTALEKGDITLEQYYELTSQHKLAGILNTMGTTAEDLSLDIDNLSTEETIGVYDAIIRQIGESIEITEGMTLDDILLQMKNKNEKIAEETEIANQKAEAANKKTEDLVAMAVATVDKNKTGALVNKEAFEKEAERAYLSGQITKEQYDYVMIKYRTLESVYMSPGLIIDNSQLNQNGIPSANDPLAMNSSTQLKPNEIYDAIENLSIEQTLQLYAYTMAQMGKEVQFTENMTIDDLLNQMLANNIEVKQSQEAYEAAVKLQKEAIIAAQTQEHAQNVNYGLEIVSSAYGFEYSKVNDNLILVKGTGENNGIVFQVTKSDINGIGRQILTRWKNFL